MNLPLNTTDLWLLGLTALTILNLILVVVLSAQKSKLRRQLKRWQTIHETADLDAIYERTLKRVENADEVIANLTASMHALELAVRTKVSTPKVKRYNAFSDTGSDLSFSVALVDDTQTGIVLSSIYGREESRTYGKPVVNGESAYPLTDEEADVLSLAPSASGRRPVKTV